MVQISEELLPPKEGWLFDYALIQLYPGQVPFWQKWKDIAASAFPHQFVLSHVNDLPSGFLLPSPELMAAGYLFRILARNTNQSTRQRHLAIFGPPGSGKSSFALAASMPMLNADTSLASTVAMGGICVAPANNLASVTSLTKSGKGHRASQFPRNWKNDLNARKLAGLHSVWRLADVAVGRRGDAITFVQKYGNDDSGDEMKMVDGLLFQVSGVTNP
ncbi:unnamed protein product, partial [Protopolystoma xenopodis]